MRSALAIGEAVFTGHSVRLHVRRRTPGHDLHHRRRGRRWAGILVGQFRSLLVLVLVAAAGASHLLGERVETGVILVIVAVNALLGFA